MHGIDRNGAVLVHISEDEMTATVDLFAAEGSGKPLELDSVEYTLLNAGVTSGVDRESLAGGIRKAEEQKEPVRGVVAATGQPAVNTVPRHYTFPIHAASIQAQEHQNVDFREVSTILIVHKNDVLAAPVDRVEGRTGLTVTGKEIPFTDAVDEQLEAGDNVAVLGGDGAYVARDDGRLIHEMGRVRVESALVVEGDVDFSTGNIRFPKDVAINGGVLDDFVVETEGNLHIKGMVGAADLYAKGSIEIAGGFSGKGHGTIRCDGDVKVAFVDNGTVVCKGNLSVPNEIVNSTVLCNGRLTCAGKRGTIMGGRVSARGGVECTNLGSLRGLVTHVQAGVDVLADSRLRAAEELIARLSEHIAAVAFGIEEAKKKGRQAPGLEKNHKELIKKLNRTVIAREQLRSVLYAKEGASVTARNKVFPGVSLSLCGVEKTVAGAAGPISFTLDASRTKIVSDKDGTKQP